jgi:hypothetical protein
LVVHDLSLRYRGAAEIDPDRHDRPPFPRGQVFI